MGRLVMKFGGTSVADIDCIRNVAQHVAREVKAGHHVAVVVSAMAGTTDRLADWCREVVAMSALGLTRQGEDPAALDPLREVIASGRSPGDVWPTGGSVAEVIAACEYPPG